MRKRLRKKLRIEEFTEFGFEVKLDVVGLDRKVGIDFLLEIVDFVESECMIMGGTYNSFYVSRNKRSVSYDDVGKMLGFFANHKYVRRVNVLPLTNSWYGGRKPATRYNYKSLRKKLWEDYFDEDDDSRQPEA